MTKARAKELNIFCAYDKIVEVGALIGNPKNPNTHPKEQIELLAEIIKFQGWRAPITVSKRSGFIVRGHGRLEAAKVLGLEYAPIDYQEYESEAAEHADLIADNRIAELSVLSDNDLKSILEEINPDEIDLTLTGFDIDTLESLLLTGLPPVNNPEDEWVGMPEFDQGDVQAYRSIIVHFPTEKAVEDFKTLVSQEFSDKARYIYFPAVPNDLVSDKRWITTDPNSGGDDE